MRNHLLDLLISAATLAGDDTMLSFGEVTQIMDYLDAYWLNNDKILFAFIDAYSIDQEGYETTGKIDECTTRGTHQ